MYKKIVEFRPSISSENKFETLEFRERGYKLITCSSMRRLICTEEACA